MSETLRYEDLYNEPMPLHLFGIENIQNKFLQWLYAHEVKKHHVYKKPVHEGRLAYHGTRYIKKLCRYKGYDHYGFQGHSDKTLAYKHGASWNWLFNK